LYRLVYQKDVVDRTNAKRAAHIKALVVSE
jgi:hypothetical protein